MSKTARPWGGMRNPAHAAQRLTRSGMVGGIVRELIDTAIETHPELLQTAQDILEGKPDIRPLPTEATTALHPPRSFPHQRQEPRRHSRHGCLRDGPNTATTQMPSPYPSGCCMERLSGSMSRSPDEECSRQAPAREPIPPPMLSSLAKHKVGRTGRRKQRSFRNWFEQPKAAGSAD